MLNKPAFANSLAVLTAALYVFFAIIALIMIVMSWVVGYAWAWLYNQVAKIF